MSAGDLEHRRLFAPGTFTWLLGIEDTCVYPPDGGAAPPLDEHVLTGHDQQWAADLDRAAQLGATAIRYGVSWPTVHLAPGRIDWSTLDERLNYAAALGLRVVADVVHYGCPPWLSDSFADQQFPEALADFCGAFAERYRGVVDHITPVNEPLTTASFCGLRGVWPPYRTGWSGWCAVTMSLVKAEVAAIEAIRTANPDAAVVHVEAAMPVETADPTLRTDAEHLRHMAYLPTDLLLGRVDANHRLGAWLVEQGADPDALSALTTAPPAIDFHGVNYYPQLSPRELIRQRDTVVQVCVDRGADGLIRALAATWERYRVPLVVTETSVEGSDDVRAKWLQLAAAACTTSARAGVDVRGLTWWPMFDFVDWSFAADGQSVEEFFVQPEADGVATPIPPPSLGDPRDGVSPFLRRMGLIRLEEEVNGSLARQMTAAAMKYRTLSTSVYELAPRDLTVDG